MMRSIAGFEVKSNGNDKLQKRNTEGLSTAPGKGRRLLRSE